MIRLVSGVRGGVRVPARARDHGILADILDLEGIRRVATTVGLPGNERGGPLALLARVPPTTS